MKNFQRDFSTLHLKISALCVEQSNRLIKFKSTSNILSTMILKNFSQHLLLNFNEN